MIIRDIIKAIEEVAPLAIQESYDNAGLLVGDTNSQATGALLTLDVTEEIVDEAISKKVNLIISHHPVIFSGLKKLTGGNASERAIIKAIRNEIAIYCAHTNIDNSNHGINTLLAERLGLEKITTLKPQGKLKKLVVFVPESHADEVRDAIFRAGAGSIGDYENCSFNLHGTGTFKASENANPFVGKINEQHSEPEVRIETILPDYLKSRIVRAMLEVHPYEEVAYDIYNLDASNPLVGSGAVGHFGNPMAEKEFLSLVKKVFGAGCLKHTKLLGRPVNKVALCSGSGSFLLQDAIGKGADVFISGDFKYHQFFDAEEKLVIVDVGHYEMEQCVKDIFYGILNKKFPKFALHFSEINSNPINYY